MAPKLPHAPTIKGSFGPYRLFFFSFDCGEPRHVRVQRERRLCKFWLDPVALADNHGFAAIELNSIRRLIRDHLTTIAQAWDEHCGNRN